MDPKQLRDYIVRPVLKDIGLWSQSAENLILGTAAQESHLKYIHQLDGGPALGLWQCEPRTHDDIWDNYIKYHIDIENHINDYIPAAEGIYSLMRCLTWNLAYGCIICRLHYLRIPEPLPPHYNITLLAQYWKKYYNTEKGAGTTDEFIKNYIRLILPILDDNT